MFLALIKIAAFTIILRLTLIWSYNLIFALGRRPTLWVFFCLFLGFGWFAFASALMKFSVSVTCWSAIAAYFLIKPPEKPSEISDADYRQQNEIIAESWGVAYSPGKYRLGLTMFAVGAITGWLFFYGSIGHV